METTSGHDPLRIFTWNIGHGGGSRIPAICRHIEEVRPDVLGLSEFRTRSETVLRANLDRLGYRHITTSDPRGNANGLLVASKYPFIRCPDQYPADTDRERWLAVRLSDFDLDVLVLHIPGGTDNKFKAGYGISGVKRKELFWENVLAYAAAHRDRRVIMMGDFNTGFRIDAEGAMFKLSHYLTELIATGFIDTWRRLHPDVRDYTWYSKHRDKRTGVSQDFNGFRLDYIFVSPALQHAIADAWICHEPRRAGVSDHASLVAHIDVGAPARRGVAFGGEITQRGGSMPLAVSEPVRETTKTTDDGLPGRLARSTGVDAGRLGIRLDLAPGELPDMTCGTNGRDLVQVFRPTYVTAQWSSGVLVEARIWGPRVLNDGSLGVRELDHVWRAGAASGGVNYDDLPGPVVSKLRARPAE